MTDEKIAFSAEIPSPLQKEQILQGRSASMYRILKVWFMFMLFVKLRENTYLSPSMEHA